MTMEFKTWGRRVQRGLVVTIMVLGGACNTDEEEIKPTPNEETSNFIPTKGKKYLYKVESEGSSAEATRWISGETDSVGINVQTMRTDISAFGQTITLKDNIFSIKGKTYTQFKLPDAWYQSIKMLDALPDIEIINTDIVGYPAYMTMDNIIKDGSKLEVSGPVQQEQHVEYTDDDEPGSMEQVLLTHAGTATVETLQLPAGTFVCNKYTYQVTKTITINAGGHTDTMNGVENITLWVAYGVGMVKLVSNEESAVLMPSPSGGIRLVKSTSSSTTTLQNIK